MRDSLCESQVFIGEIEMTRNVGGIDRVLRIVAGLVLIGLAFAGIGTPWTWIGVVPLATGLFQWCPAYAPFGFSSCAAKPRT